MGPSSDIIRISPPKKARNNKLPQGGQEATRGAARAARGAKSAQRAGTSARGAGKAARGVGATARGRGASPRGRGASPQGRGAAARGRGASPRGRGAAISSTSPRPMIMNVWSCTGEDTISLSPHEDVFHLDEFRGKPAKIKKEERMSSLGPQHAMSNGCGRRPADHMRDSYHVLSPSLESGGQLMVDSSSLHTLLEADVTSTVSTSAAVTARLGSGGQNSSSMSALSSVAQSRSINAVQQQQQRQQRGSIIVSRRNGDPLQFVTDTRQGAGLSHGYRYRNPWTLKLFRVRNVNLNGFSSFNLKLVVNLYCLGSGSVDP
jgi:hypothetical protein